MKRIKLYFEDSDSEVCYPLDYFTDSMDSSESEITLYEAIPDKIPGCFWCKVQYFCGDDSRDTCGKQCNDYKPRNGKSGCCKHYATTLYIHGEKVTLKTN